MTERVTVFLSRRNLLTLLNKLDRVKAGGVSHCALMKNDNQHPTCPQNVECVWVQAVEDDEYYKDRAPGTMHPLDDPGLSL